MDRKEKAREYQRQYRIRNADKIKEQRSTPEYKAKVKERDRLRWLNNDNNWKETCAEYRENNREKINEKRKQSYQQNREKELERQKTPNARMTKRIYDWKRQGLKCDNYEDLYNYFITTEKCEKCDCDLVGGGRAKNSRVMDHCHISGEFRNVLCRACNATLPKQI